MKMFLLFLAVSSLRDQALAIQTRLNENRLRAFVLISYTFFLKLIRIDIEYFPSLKRRQKQI